MALSVDGYVYTINYRNRDINNPNSMSISITGNTYGPDIIWSLAKAMIPAVKTNWYLPTDVVYVESIQSYGGTTDVIES
jgi:hypothetical protein